MITRTVTAVLDAPKDAVFEYLSKIENLPDWATEFAHELKYEDGRAKVVNGLGEFYFSIDADAASGVIDMYSGPGEGELALFPTRVVALGPDRSAYVFTMFKAPEMPDELFESQYESLRRGVRQHQRSFRRRQGDLRSVIAEAHEAHSALSRDDLGFLLAKASQRWNELLAERFAAAGFPEVRPSYGSILVPLFEEDGLRLGEIARRARLSKQTMTTTVRLLERDGLVERRLDPRDGRATLVFLTPRAEAFRPVAEQTLRDLARLSRRWLGAATADTLGDALRQLAELD